MRSGFWGRAGGAVLGGKEGVDGRDEAGHDAAGVVKGVVGWWVWGGDSRPSFEAREERAPQDDGGVCLVRCSR
jgi:hypothetical protein